MLRMAACRHFFVALSPVMPIGHSKTGPLKKVTAAGGLLAVLPLA